MKKMFQILLTITIALSFAATGCKKEAAKTPEPTPVAKPADKPADKPAPVAKAGISKEDYVKAAIEIGCLAQTLKDKTQMPAKAMEVHKKYGFDKTTWVESAKKFAGDPEVGKKIAAGMTTCK